MDAGERRQAILSVLDDVRSAPGMSTEEIRERLNALPGVEHCDHYKVRHQLHHLEADGWVVRHTESGEHRLYWYRAARNT